MFQRVGVWIGAKELFGLEASWATIAERLRGYSLFDVLNTVGRVDAILHNGNPLDPALQMRLADGLLGQDTGAAIRRKLARKIESEASQRHAPSHFVLFGQKPLTTLLQVAVHVCEQTVQRTSSLHNIGMALLLMNDLMESDPASPQKTDPSTPEGRQAWLYFLSHAASERGAEASVHLIARAADLFLSTPPHLRGHPDFVDLSALFFEASGLSIDAYVLVILAFLGGLYSIDASNVHQRNATINIKQFESDHLRFTEADTDKFFALVGLPVDEFVERMIGAYPHGTLQPLYLLPLEESPIVRFGDSGVCHSIHLLESRLTSGLYHLLLNAKADKASRAKLQRLFGSVFADYVDRSFERISKGFPNRNKRRKGKVFSLNSYFRERQLSEQISRTSGPTLPLCDGILVFNDMAVLVESKARLFPLAARSEGDLEKFFTRLREIVVGGARQLDATLGHLAEGRFQNLPIELRALRRVVPIIVSLQDVALNPMLRDWIDLEIKAAGYFVEPRVAHARVSPVQFFGPGDLEMLELIVEDTGKEPNVILAQFLNDDYGKGYSFSSWIGLRHKAVFASKKRLRYHGDRYLALTRGATELYLASRTLGTAEPIESDETPGPARLS